MNRKLILRRGLERSLHCRNLDTVQKPRDSRGFLFERGRQEKKSRVGPLPGRKKPCKTRFRWAQDRSKLHQTGVKTVANGSKNGRSIRVRLKDHAVPTSARLLKEVAGSSAARYTGRVKSACFSNLYPQSTVRWCKTKAFRSKRVPGNMVVCGSPLAVARPHLSQLRRQGRPPCHAR